MHILIDLNMGIFSPEKCLDLDYLKHFNNIISYAYIFTHAFIYFSISISKILRITNSTMLVNLNYKLVHSIQSINCFTKELNNQNRKHKEKNNLSKNLLRLNENQPESSPIPMLFLLEREYPCLSEIYRKNKIHLWFSN